MTECTLQAIRHVGFEDLGSFEAPLRAAGYQIEYIDAAERDLSQLDPLAADLLVVLGGPIGVYDHDRYPLVSAELEILRARLAADKPTLGICLGAQLMAAALGSTVYPGPAKEIGWSTLELAASDYQPLAALHDVAVLHWHGDTFDLPEGAVHLAQSKACRQQAFFYPPGVLGLQFHLESTWDSINALMRHCGDELVPAPYIQSRAQIRNHRDLIRPSNDIMYNMLDIISRVQ